MFKQLFKENSLFSKAIILILSLLLWFVPTFDVQAYVFESNSFLFSYINITEYSVLLSLDIIAYALVLLQAFMIYRITQSLRLFPVRNIVVSFIYILFMGFFDTLTSFNPFVVGNTFFLLALLFVFKASEKSKAYQDIFNAGLLIALASLSYSFYAVFFIAIIPAFFLLGLQSMRNMGIVVVGYITPFIFLFTWFFLTDDLAAMQEKLMPAYIHDFSLQNIITSIQDFFSLVLFVFIFLISFVFMILFKTKRSIAQIKMQSLILWFLFFCLFVFVLAIEQIAMVYLISAPLLSISLSLQLVYGKKPILSEIILLVFLLLLIFDRFY